MSPAEALEVSMVQSVAGTLEEGRISSTRPFRAPHHSASMAALTGGGVRCRSKRESVYPLRSFPKFKEFDSQELH